LYTGQGSERLTDAVNEFAQALAEQGSRLPAGSEALAPLRSDVPPREALGELLAPLFTPNHLRQPSDVFGNLFIKNLIEMGYLLGPAGEMVEAGQARKEGGAEEKQDKPVPKEKVPEEGVPVERDVDPVRYNLVVWLDRVEATRMTPGWTDDEFRVGGNFMYTGAVTHPITQMVTPKEESIKAWEKDYEDDGQVADGIEEALPHKMLDIPIPEGDQIFMLTLTPSEEDALSTEAASALGKLSAALGTAGIDVLVGLAIASGFSVAPGISSLVPEAQELINKHAMPGLSGLIQQLLGPELFEMPNIKVETNWQPGTPVFWKSWAWFSDIRTVPHESTGPGEHQGDNLIVNEMRIRPDENNVLQMTVIDSGGTYKLDIRVQVTEV